MSQKVTRKSAVNDEKEKRQTDSPVKEMKKKMAANAEKEKHLTEKITEKHEKNDKSVEKVEKTDKGAEKSTEKTSKAVEKTDKAAEKTEKSDKTKIAEKTEKPDKSKAADKIMEKNDKSVEKKLDKADKKGEPEKVKEDGKEKTDKKPGRRSQNGVQETNGATEPNGTEDANGTVSGESDEDAMLVIDDHDELFPELAYDDTSDLESFEPPTPDPASRSLTRRSQVKSARTPETPRPASDKQPDADDPKESKVLKMKDELPTTDRKLRSADSPKPQDKKQESKKDVQESKEQEREAKEQDSDNKEDKVGKVEVEVIVEVEANEAGGADRKPDTNYSKSRVKVSPYRRSLRLADNTNCSLLANYTGNNTTMEMDITESSFQSEEGADDSGYLRGLRTIRGRSSYKQLKDLPLKHTTRRTQVNVSVSSDSSIRPTGTVVGRKRKPEGAGAGAEAEGEAVAEAEGEAGAGAPGAGKRLRLLERIAHPFRRTITSPLLPRRAAEIVGINTDLPLTAPVASPDAFDPETLKPAEPAPTPILTPTPTPAFTPTHEDRDSKKCIVM